MPSIFLRHEEKWGADFRVIEPNAEGPESGTDKTYSKEKIKKALLTSM